jgi:coenzyme Q-binding protein COQ10
MPEVAVNHRVRHSAAEMCELVADVERYPAFVPLCEKLLVRARSRQDGRDVLIADMTVGYKAFRETFSTRVAVDRAALAIDFAYVSGPFQRLSGTWRFEPVAARESVVHFSVDYEFRSRILSMLMGAVFDQAFRRFAEAFEARADVVYGAGASRPTAVRGGA